MGGSLSINKKQLKEKALLHSKTKPYKKKVIRASKYIMEFLEKSRNPYVAFSAGKDSSVTAHLTNLLSPNIPMIYVKNDSLDFPENTPTMKKIANKFNFNVKILESKTNGWEEIKKLDELFGQLNVASSTLDEKCFYNPINRYVEKNNKDGVIMGLRAEESRARNMNYKSRGHIYTKKDGMVVCNPISKFNGLDVFAYLFSNQIPISPIYFKTKSGRQPERIREGWWPPGEKTSKYGYCNWLKYYYPDLFNKLSSEFPEVRQYV